MFTATRFFRKARLSPSRRPAAAPAWRRVRLRVEELEPYNLLSAAVTAVPLAQPDLQASPAAAPTDPTATPLAHSSGTVSGPYTPAQIKTAYGFNLLTQTGSGETVAIVDAYDDPNIASDLATFDSQWGLAAANFTKVNQTGGSALPAPNASWSVEISLDVEWAHAIAPGANILLVEANSNSVTDLMTAVQYAAGHANVVSMSWGSGEFSGQTSYDSIFAQYPSVTFVASSGDSGAASGPEWPAISPYVVAVGGTSLTLNSTGTYKSESGWSGSGGGISKYESQPTYQQGVVTQSTTSRTNPDVAYDANPNTGFYVADSYYQPGYTWYEVGGTSAGAPQWSALIALADQSRGASNPLGEQADAALYALYHTSAYKTDFHDITSGNNHYAAGTGYDLVTGLGSPVANALVPSLAGFTSSAQSSSATQSSSTTGTGGTGGTGTGGTTHRHDILIVIDVTQTTTSQVATAGSPVAETVAQLAGAAASRSTAATAGLTTGTASTQAPVFLTPAASTAAAVPVPSAPVVRTAGVSLIPLAGTTGLTTSSVTHYYMGSAAEGDDLIPDTSQQPPQAAPQVAPEKVPESDDAPYNPDLAGDWLPDLLTPGFTPDGGVVALPEAGSLPPVLTADQECTLPSLTFAAALVFLGGAWKLPAEVTEEKKRRRDK
jgi:subtilase family serine protease